jgi:L-seryl-tRNA(Ser) seleniumtransferase
MWSRRRFLESISSLPIVGGLVGAGTAATAVVSAAKGNRDYLRELGVRPFINAAGTYTAMTASLMPPEVMDAINYATSCTTSSASASRRCSSVKRRWSRRALPQR